MDEGKEGRDPDGREGSCEVVEFLDCLGTGEVETPIWGSSREKVLVLPL